MAPRNLNFFQVPMGMLIRAVWGPYFKCYLFFLWVWTPRPWNLGFQEDLPCVSRRQSVINTQLLQVQKWSLYCTKRLNIYKRRSKEAALLGHLRSVAQEGGGQTTSNISVPRQYRPESPVNHYTRGRSFSTWKSTVCPLVSSLACKT